MSWIKKSNTPTGGTSDKITGKKINCLGDSITRGNANGATPWVDMLATQHNCTVRNYGVSGTTLSNRGDGFSMVERYLSMDNDADVVIVWGGWNDVNQGRPLGVFGSTDNTTFYGALNIMLNDLQSKYLGKKIFICTILSTEHSWTTVKNYNNAIREVSEYYAIEVIEMSRLGISARNLDVKTAYIPDNVHPNTAGNQIVTDFIASFLNSH